MALILVFLVTLVVIFGEIVSIVEVAHFGYVEKLSATYFVDEASLAFSLVLFDEFLK